MASDSVNRKMVDDFYKENGACCAGCDHWRYFNSVIGECIKTKPVPSNERMSMQYIKSSSIDLGCGHIITDRDHLCGEFDDSKKAP